ncbi:Dr1-associated corepressor [Orchesella cincta]|uniref:Dr1-associated corepressor n=1 Tax=Orchesella cincta TaxID=48709 RepID=A0A1D2N5Z4_ORCCI|nr:Dr1-associated corepressor [Orchesella cincta]
MPSKKKKYNARFPPARIKKIMQSDEEVGKVAQAVPVIISRALELFVESLLKKAEGVTHSRNAKTLTPSHLKQCIMAEQRFDFLKDVVSAIPDVQGDEDAETPRSTISNTAFVFPPSSSSTSSSSAPQTPSSATPTPLMGGSGEPSTATASVSTPSYTATLPDQNPSFGGAQNASGGVHHSLPMTIPAPSFPARSVQSTINPTVPVIVPNPSVIQQQHLQPNSHSILNPVRANSNPYIPSVSVPSHPGGVGVPVNSPGAQYNMYHQPNNPNGMGIAYGSVNEQMLSYGVRGADGSLTSANPAMISNMYDHKNSSNSYQYLHHPQHQNQYHSQ